jgi:hypothetical protein
MLVAANKTNSAEEKKNISGLRCHSHCGKKFQDGQWTLKRPKAGQGSA